VFYNNNNDDDCVILQLPQVPPTTEHHDYEEIQAHYQINSPQRPAPPRPALTAAVATTSTGRSGYGGTGTLGTYTELEGVPFTMNAMLQRSQPMTDVSICTWQCYRMYTNKTILSYIVAYTARNLNAA